MNNITTKQFQQLTDINLVWDFMVEVYDNRFVNGVVGTGKQAGLHGTVMHHSGVPWKGAGSRGSF